MPSTTVHVSESALDTIRAAATLSHPLETGGILVGVHTSRYPWVTHAVEVRTAERGHTAYRLPAGVTRRAVSQLRDLDPRVGYLGDWHSHPMDVPASATDRLTTVTTAVRTMQPTLLLIARCVEDQYAIDLHVARGVRLRTCAMIPAGDLPVPSTESEHTHG
ncbi:Mov34/MPN/PAD-1 family protein [Microbacterium sp. S1037]|uniref:Mov34/MPN/PAD-1 family protein n=1 Tax=Microbacterium sp. S1037 TaxID=3398227 RepID=UPI003AB06D1B